MQCSFLNDGPPIYGGRELWGFPKKYAQPSLSVDKDTLIGTLNYGPVRIATGTMGFKHKALDLERVRAGLTKPNYLLKIIPHVDGSHVFSSCRLPSRGHRHEGRMDRAGHARA